MNLYIIEVKGEHGNYAFDGAATSLRSAKRALAEWCDMTEVFNLTWDGWNRDVENRRIWYARAFSGIGKENEQVWSWRVTEIAANVAGVDL